MLNSLTPAPVEWDHFVLAHPRAHPLQLSAWGDLKSAYGWKIERVALGEKNTILAGAQILFRPLPLKVGTMAYLPYGGYVTDESQWDSLWEAAQVVSKKHRAVFLKWEPGLGFSADFVKWRFQESPQTIQPPRTILIDISGSDEAIMSRMNQGTRRKIRQSLKSEIRYDHGDRAVLDIFNQMMQSTGSRNEFGVHAPSYYAHFHEGFIPDHAALILAEHEGDPLAGIIVSAAGNTAQYLYGASSDVKRNLMATYGIQWQAIQWAKARGCTQYDMWGIPDEDEAALEAQFQQRSDGLWGVYGFKRGWGGKIVRSAGAWDQVYQPALYLAYKTALRFRG